MRELLYVRGRRGIAETETAVRMNEDMLQLKVHEGRLASLGPLNPCNHAESATAFMVRSISEAKVQSPQVKLHRAF